MHIKYITYISFEQIARILALSVELELRSCLDTESVRPRHRPDIWRTKVRSYLYGGRLVLILFVKTNKQVIVILSNT